MKVDEYNRRMLDAIVNNGIKPDERKVVGALSESKIQQSCVTWFKMQYRQLWDDGVFYHIPNERKCSDSVGARLKREGVVRGVADLCLAISRHGYIHLYIEMKQPGKYQQPHQKAWEQGVKKHGNMYAVVKSLDQFMQLINWYVNE